MLGLTVKEIAEHLKQYPELRWDGQTLHFADPEPRSICIDLRVKEPHQLVYLARLVGHLGYEDIDFRGAYLWLTSWGTWSAPVEAIGLKILEQFRRGHGENRPLDLAPGNYFRHDEFAESVCCLLQPMIVGWDAFYVPRWRHGQLDYFVAVSHDSFVNVEVRTKEMYHTALGILSGNEWIRVVEHD